MISRSQFKDPPIYPRVREIVRRNEPQFGALGLSDETNDDDVLRAMAEHPILIERPIVVRSGRAVVGRPPEKVREILG